MANQMKTQRVSFKKTQEIMETSFSFINSVFAASGCRVYPSRYAFLNFLDTLHCLLLITCQLGLLIYSIPQRDLGQLNFVEKVRSVLHKLMSVIFVIIIRRNRKSLRKLLDIIARHLTRKDLDSLTLFARIFSVNYWIFIACNWLISVSYDFKKPYFIDVMDLLEVFPQFIGWIFGGVSCFMFVILALKYMEKNVISNLCEEMKTEPSSLTPSQVSLRIRNIYEVKAQLENVFSCIPCFWYFYVFAKVLVIFINLQLNYSAALGNTTKFHTDPDDIFFMIQSIMTFFVLILLLFVSESMSKNSRELTEKLFIAIVKKNDTKAWLNSMTDLEAVQSFELTAWDLFSINKKLLLYFTSSLVTFTVLFAQVVNKLPTR